MSQVYASLITRLGNGFFFKPVNHEREKSGKKFNSKKNMFFHELVNGRYVIFFMSSERLFSAGKNGKYMYPFNATSLILLSFLQGVWRYIENVQRICIGELDTLAESRKKQFIFLLNIAFLMPSKI